MFYIFKSAHFIFLLENILLVIYNINFIFYIILKYYRDYLVVNFIYRNTYFSKLFI